MNKLALLASVFLCFAALSCERVDSSDSILAEMTPTPTATPEPGVLAIPVGSLTGHKGFVTTLLTLPPTKSCPNGDTDCMVADYPRMASTGWDGSVRLWDLRTNKPMWSSPYIAKDVPLNSLAVTSDGRYLAAAGSYDHLKLISLASGKVVKSFTTRPGLMHTAVSISADNAYLISGSADLKVRVWDMKNQTELWSLKGHEWPIRAVSLSYDNRYVFAASSTEIIAWDIVDGKEVRRIRHPDAANRPAPDLWIEHAQFSPDTKYIVVGSGHDVSVISTANGAEYRKFPYVHAELVSASFSPDLCCLATSGFEGATRIWDLENGKIISTAFGLDFPFFLSTAVTFGKDIHHFYTVSFAGTIRAWKIPQ